jgi:hypothetical protein
MKILQAVVLGSLGLSQLSSLAGWSSTASIAVQDVTSQVNSDVIAHIGCLSASYQAAVRQYVPPQKLSEIIPYLPKLSERDCFLNIVGMLAQTTDGGAFVFSQFAGKSSGKLSLGTKPALGLYTRWE